MAIADANHALAGSTIIIAFATWRDVAPGRRAGDATERSAISVHGAAEASRYAAAAAPDDVDSSAQLAREPRQDRDLALQPHLMPDVITPVSTATLTYAVRNIGPGRTSNVLGWAYHRVNEPGTWAQATTCTLGAAASTQRPSTTDKGDCFPASMFPASPNPDLVSTGFVVAACSTIAGNRWQILDGYGSDQVHLRDSDPTPWAARMTKPGPPSNPSSLFSSISRPPHNLWHTCSAVEHPWSYESGGGSSDRANVHLDHTGLVSELPVRQRQGRRRVASCSSRCQMSRHHPRFANPNQLGWLVITRHESAGAPFRPSRKRLGAHVPNARCCLPYLSDSRFGWLLSGRRHGQPARMAAHLVLGSTRGSRMGPPRSYTIISSGDL